MCNRIQPPHFTALTLSGALNHCFPFNVRMAGEQNTALAVINNNDETHLSLVQQPASENRLVRYSASKISSQDFPDGFLFGASTAAYQVEGGYAEGGRSLSNWDVFSLTTPGKIADGSNGCVATDQFHRYEEDVKLIKKLGLTAYRFSISWSRVLPGGRLSTGKSKAGIQYYNNLIDCLLAHGIEPFVTIFHMDLPQILADEYGGFSSEKILKDYLEFAELCFWEFGDRVKHWMTMNEPLIYVTQGYLLGNFPPTSKVDPLSPDKWTEPYLVAHNLILAHASAVDSYRRNFQAAQGGRIGMANSVSWFEPLNESDSEDWKAALRSLDFSIGWFVEPTVTGQYPESMRKLIGDRLPKFTEEQEILVKGSFDFLAFNYYTGRYVKSDPSSNSVPTVDMPFGPVIRVAALTERDGVPIGPSFPGSYWIISVPWGLQKLLNYTKIKYGDPFIYITENGVSDLNDKTLSVTEALVDNDRLRYIQDHLYYLKKAIDDDKVKVQGYFVWSLLDNYEWSSGYTNRFGLYYVDFVNGLARYPKKSAVWFLNFFNKKLIELKKRSREEEEAEDGSLAKRAK